VTADVTVKAVGQNTHLGEWFKWLVLVEASSTYRLPWLGLKPGVSFFSVPSSSQPNVAFYYRTEKVDDIKTGVGERAGSVRVLKALKRTNLTADATTDISPAAWV